MINASTSVSFSSAAQDNVAGQSLILEPDYKGEEKSVASLGSSLKLLSYVRSGRSALEYMVKNCPYTKMDGEDLLITLGFTVWPNVTTLDYGVVSTSGIVDVAVPADQETSFDVIFNGTYTENLPFVFDGELSPQMPFIASDGDILTGVTVTQEDNLIRLSEKAYCVIRADGTISGYHHNVEIRIPKLSTAVGGYKIDDLVCTITATWYDPDMDSETLDLIIPPCVEEILGYCKSQGGAILNLRRKKLTKVDAYYSECDGSIVDVHVIAGYENE